MSAVQVKCELVGTDKLVAKFSGYVGRLQPELLRAMDIIVNKLVNYIQANKLSGQVLHRRTGALSRSIKGTFKEQGGSIVGEVTSRDKGNAPLPYAAYHEHGFSGTMNVRDHVRRIAHGDFAGELTPVRAHLRHVNYKAHPFFKPSRDENQTFIQNTLQAAVSRANKA